MAKKKAKKLTYRQAGVSRENGDRLVDYIVSRVASLPKDPRVAKNAGGYASLYRLAGDQYIAATTDGVGTKLRLAIEEKDHSTVGIDLVAMSVNDLLCVGARPLFFLDYFASGKLKLAQAEEIIGGVIEGCREAGCALVGGETAEMPSLYRGNDYDLAGFAVGLVAKKRLLPKKLRPGLSLVGLGSSGFHSNGYSLVRKLLSESRAPKSIRKLALAPTRIYAQALAPLLEKGLLSGLAHITGSGYLNVPRMSEDVSYWIELPPIRKRPKIYAWLDSLDRVTYPEAIRTFNMGYGMVAAVEPKHVKTVLAALAKAKIPAAFVGETIEKPKGARSQVHVVGEEGFATLTY